MHMSRSAVFHSTAILVSGVFLLAIATAGYVVRFIGGEWGAIVVADDENIDWFATAREAKAACQAHADRAAR